MGWKRVDVIFRLKTPLHIGYLPSGGTVIAPTRYYVTGRNLWGAFTKKATECLFHAPRPSHYQGTGKKVRESFRFTHFFVCDGKTIYVPVYTERGLRYGDIASIGVLEFEHRFIGSIVLTAIQHTEGTAKDESLHEIEFIKDRYLDEDGEIRNTRLIGCIWIKDGSRLPSETGEKDVRISENGIFVDDFNLIEEMIFGGERNYGFGLVEGESVCRGKFKINDHSNEDIRIVVEKNNPIFFHLEYDNNIPFEGNIELLSGREYPQDSASECFERPGLCPVRPRYFFSPGTLFKTRIQCDLTWEGTGKVDRKA